jgi:hypothetical protein
MSKGGVVMAEKIATTNGAVLTAHEATVQTVQVEIRVCPTFYTDFWHGFGILSLPC